ncbi:MAG: hypothetical protein U1E62_26355 [Alsobacter sp.]
MKIAIFGRHPIPQPGFMGVMSLYEAKYFSLFGHEVDLLIPFQDREALRAFLQKAGVSELDELDKFGGSFSIRPLFLGDGLPTRYDVCIYQSYDVNDWENYIRILRSGSRMMTKNFPKFVTGPGYASDQNVLNQFKAFDLVACALNDDIDELKANPAIFDTIAHKLAYVPRGADDTILTNAGKSPDRPRIGIDTPNSTDIRAISHYFDPIQRVKAKYPDLEVLLIGSTVTVDGYRNVPFGRFDNTYRNFFNQISCYLTVNYAFSAPHTRSAVQQQHPADWRNRAIYEVQNIEAQMSGAPLVGHPSNLIAELYDRDVSGFEFDDFSNAEQIEGILTHILDNQSAVSAATRAFALSNFRWEDCIRRWEVAIVASLNHQLARAS